jgi:hypothetical protein
MGRKHSARRIALGKTRSLVQIREGTFMSFYLTGALALLFALAVLPVRAADWSFDVVPESSRKGELFISIHHPFYVVLTNVTDHDLTVWKEWCSWGYFNLSFEFTGKDGKVVKVEKDHNLFWTKNGPDGFVVMPGKHFVLSVTLSIKDKTADMWIGAERLDGAMTLQAIYKNTNEAFPGEKPNPQNKFPSDMQKRIDSAWLGQVESEPMQVTVER